MKSIVKRVIVALFLLFFFLFCLSFCDYIKDSVLCQREWRYVEGSSE